jgi:hypothetical protein
MDPLAAGDAVTVADMTQSNTPLDDQSAGAVEKRAAVERRGTVERRSGLERRRGPGRRRSDSRRSAEEGEMSNEQLEFVLAMDEYKRANGPKSWKSSNTLATARLRQWANTLIAPHRTLAASRRLPTLPVLRRRPH